MSVIGQIIKYKLTTSRGRKNSEREVLHGRLCLIPGVKDSMQVVFVLRTEVYFCWKRAFRGLE